MKSSSGWEIVTGTEGNNISGFNALPGGILQINYESKKETFIYMGTGEYWSTSTEINAEKVIVRLVGKGYAKLE